MLLPTYLWSGAIAYLLLLGVAAATAPWFKIRDNEAQHIFLGTVVMLCLLWVMRGGIQEGLSFHLLGMTLLCLMFEWQFALFAASLVVAVATLVGPADWQAFGVNVLVMGALPILFTRLSLYLGQRLLPHNYFVYTLVNGFLTGALSMLLVMAASMLLQQWAGPSAPAGSFLALAPMLMFGEGFINGGAITLIVAYRPHWVATFHDRWYLQDK